LLVSLANPIALGNSQPNLTDLAATFLEILRSKTLASKFSRLYYTLKKIKWQYIFFGFVGIGIIRGRNLHIFIIEKHKKEKKDVVFL